MQEMPDEMLKQLRLGYRFGITKDWAQAAHAVAIASRLPSAQDIWEYISAYTTLGVPAPDGGVDYFFTHHPTSHLDQYVFLTPIIAADSERLPSSDARLTYGGNPPSQAIAFSPGPRSIYLAEFEISSTARGILLLREAYHAKSFVNRTDADAQVNIVNGWTECFDILLAIGGQIYAELLEQTTTNCHYDAATNMLTLPQIDPAHTAPMWAQQFGASSTPLEQLIWDELLQYHAAWGVAKQHAAEPFELFATLLAKRQTSL